MEYIRQYLFKVLSILVYIEWIDLPNFDREFVSHVDGNGRWDRQDKDLPLDIQTIGNYHNANTLARDFRRDQYKFIPIIIKEGRDEDYPTEKYVLPFCNGAKVIGEGSFFKVYETTIPCGQFESFLDGALNLEVRESPRSSDTMKLYRLILSSQKLWPENLLSKIIHRLKASKMRSKT